MRSYATCSLVLFGLAVLSGLPAYAQNKTACDLLSKADAEAVLGVTLQPPKPTEPFRSLLDPDFTRGTPDQACSFTNFVPNQPKPAKVVSFLLEVRYSATPDAHAVDETHKQVDTRTYDHPTDLPGLGDAAFWIGAPNNVTLFVFLGGTTRLMIGPSEIGLEQEKALAAKALAALRNTGFAYGAQPTGLKKPVLSKPGPNQTALDQLKRALTAKADAGDPQGWLVLGFEYDTGKLGGDPPYWHQKAMESYRKAADGGNCLAMMAIGDLYAAGSGVRADQAQAQSWHTKAQSCQGGNIAMLQQQVTQYKARAAAARDPALYPVLAALPDIPNSPAQAPRNNPRAPAQARNADSSGFNKSIVEGLVAAAVIVIALDLLAPHLSPGNASSGYPPGMDPVAMTQPFVDLANHQACVFHVQAQLAGGYGSGETCGW